MISFIALICFVFCMIQYDGSNSISVFWIVAASGFLIAGGIWDIPRALIKGIPKRITIKKEVDDDEGEE